MMQKIDMNSEEFIQENIKTKKFTDKVCESRNWVYNPIEDVNEGVTMGLTRNKLIYNKRYCPCFMVEGETKEERKAADNRICPCKPAIEKEIPEDGTCHCGIFCTPEYAQANQVKPKEEETKEHSQGLNKEECENMLTKKTLNSNELESLLEARELKFVDFNLVDVREWMEWKQKRIAQTDFLVPTTTFYDSVKEIEGQKDKNTIVYCLSGSRSAQVQNVMLEMGFKNVANLSGGISSFYGKTTSGDK